MTSRGVLMFAYNNEKVDYERIALLNAKLIRKFLDVDVTIVVGDKDTENVRTFRYHDGNETVSWHNRDRMSAYDRSPYDQTLLLDVDYLIMSKNLNFVWDIPQDFLCADKVFDVTHTGSFDGDRMLSKTSFPMRWATCIYFKKTPFAKSVFDMMEQVRDNYRYYAHTFNFRTTPYRNDFALSVALQLLSGYQDQARHFHFPLASLSTEECIREVREDGTIVFDYRYGSDRGVSRIKGLDLHVMNKRNLMEVYDEFDRYASQE